MWLWVLDALVSYKIIVRVHQEFSFFVSGVAWNFHVGFLVLEDISLFFWFFFFSFPVFILRYTMGLGCECERDEAVYSWLLFTIRD